MLYILICVHIYTYIYIYTSLLYILILLILPSSKTINCILFSFFVHSLSQIFQFSLSDSFFRYSVDINLDKNIVNKEVLKEPSRKRKARMEIKQKFEERYKTGKNKWFFTKLRF